MTTIEKKSLRVGRYVDANHVNTLIRTYKQERWQQNSERIGQDDSLSLFYSIEELEEFLQKAKEAGANGVSVHFGVYPENFNEREGYAGKQTTVFVATDRQETATGIAHKNVYHETNKGKQLLAYNMGQWPPGSGTDTDWNGLGVTIVDKGDKGMIVI
ncbi:hypothetical protein [Niastella sp. OAS944]|uniref:hypothetical protein n=1 Tax=Niastella sp. OAS944 TaxID=2664089 RepID=UPI003469D129|nr:pyridoxine 5'-phosphate synthase PdxJ [Chitinophagaceae bacterium OAS944]